MTSDWKTPLGSLTMSEIFVSYDGPRLFSCRSQTGTLYLVMFADETESGEDWLIGTITPAQLQEGKEGLSDLRTLFVNSTKRGAFLLHHSLSSDDSSIRAVFAEEIPPVYLPDAGVSLSPQIILRDANVPKLVQRLSVRSSRGESGDLSLGAVGRVTELWSLLVSSFQVDDEELGELVALGATTGSVVLELGSSSPTLVPKAVSAVLAALELNGNPKKLRTQLRGLPIDPFRLVGLLELVGSKNLRVIVETLGTKELIDLEPHRAHAMAKQLRDALGLMLDTAEVPQADSLARLFRLVSATHDGLEITESSTDIVPRQISYYRQAARLLGFLDAGNAVTITGENLVGAGKTGQLALTATQFENSRCGSAWLKWTKVGDLSSLKADTAARFLTEVTLLSESTAYRRAQTLTAWLSALRDYSKARFS